MRRLSKNLRPIYEYELQSGNSVVSVDEPAYTDCPLEVVFRDPLHFDDISRYLSLPDAVEKWENRDTHYPLQAGFYCNETKHSLAGPLDAWTIRKLTS